MAQKKNAARKKAEKSVEELLKYFGEDPKREGLVKTPERVVKAYEKMLAGYKMDSRKFVTTFESDGYDEMILVKDIEFYSLCEHHMLPFFGKAHIGYIPDKRLIGLSKIPRIVEMYARRMQNQERLTNQIAEELNNLLKPKGVGVVLEAQHLCMMCRGVEKQNSRIITSSVRGLFKKDMNTRTEFLRLIGK